MAIVRRIIVSRARNPYVGEFYINRARRAFVSTNTQRAYQARPHELAKIPNLSRSQKIMLAQDIRSRKPVGVFLKSRIKRV